MQRRAANRNHMLSEVTVIGRKIPALSLKAELKRGAEVLSSFRRLKGFIMEFWHNVTKI